MSGDDAARTKRAGQGQHAFNDYWYVTRADSSVNTPTVPPTYSAASHTGADVHLQPRRVSRMRSALVVVARGPASLHGADRAYDDVRHPDRCVVWSASEDLPAVGSTWAGAVVEHAYLVDVVRHWDDGVEPALVRFAFVAALPGVSDERFRERYLAHAPLARVQHPAICRYLQTFVIAGTEPNCAAVAQLHFADAQSMRTAFYRDADSPHIVAADIADFLDRDRTWSALCTPRPPVTPTVAPAAGAPPPPPRPPAD